MSWDHFVIFAMAALLCWAIGAVAAWKEKRQFVVYAATLAGLAVFFCFYPWDVDFIGTASDAYNG